MFSWQEFRLINCNYPLAKASALVRQHTWQDFRVQNWQEDTFNGCNTYNAFHILGLSHALQGMIPLTMLKATCSHVRIPRQDGIGRFLFFKCGGFRVLGFVVSVCQRFWLDSRKNYMIINNCPSISAKRKSGKSRFGNDTKAAGKTVKIYTLHVSAFIDEECEYILGSDEDEYCSGCLTNSATFSNKGI